MWHGISAPEGMQLLLEQYQCEPEKMLMVGDRAVDIDTVLTNDYLAIYNAVKGE